MQVIGNKFTRFMWFRQKGCIIFLNFVLEANSLWPQRRRAMFSRCEPYELGQNPRKFAF